MSSIVKYSNNLVNTTPSIVSLTINEIVGATLEGEIWWIPINTVFEIKGNVALPDTQVMVMVEKVVDATQPVEDIRFIATISNGEFSLKGKFITSGNYVITAERLNRGLDRINFPVQLRFNKVEFDAYIPVDVN